MPTGYTSGIADGSVTDFKDYALKCAYAFGALASLRESDQSTDIPELEPSDYHIKKLEEANSNLSELVAMDADKKISTCEKFNADRNEVYKKAVSDNRNKRIRYEKMLHAAKSFIAPTPKHKAYATFLVSQLESSIDFDLYDHEKPKHLAVDEWFDRAIEGAKKDIEYHKRNHKEEIDRINKANAWINELKGALE